MRAFDIILFLICIQAAVGFVATLSADEGLFSINPLDMVEYENSTKYTEDYTIEEITREYGGEHGNDTAFGEVRRKVENFTNIVSALGKAVIMFFNMLFFTLFIYFPLVNLFGVPQSLALFIQVGLSFIYMWGIVQFLSNRSTKHMT